MTESLKTIRTTRAAILADLHKPLVVAEITLPEALAFGQVLVRIHASGICGAQINEIDGAKGPDKFLPHLLGHEGGGVVVEVGPAVKKVKPGDHVVLHWRKSIGIEAEPAVYTWRGRPLNAGWVTTFSEYAVISENRLTPIPTDVDLPQAALFGCPVTTAMGVVTRDAKLTPGESIVVVGAGGVGLSVIQAARLVSADPIVAIDLYDNKLALARKLGATHIIKSGAGAGNLAAAVRDVVGTAGADVVVETTGRSELIEVACEMTQPRGRTILVGVPDASKAASLHTLPLYFGKVLTGSHGGGCQPHEDIPRYLKLALAGKLDLAALITSRIALSGINQAIDDMRTGRIAGRCSIDMSRIS